MTDAILMKAMEMRDEALHGAERWEEWIKGYLVLSEPTPDSLDIPMVRSASPQIEPAGGINLASSLRDPALRAEVGNGTTIWPRGGGSAV